MNKRPTSYRLSNETKRQLQKLADKYGETVTDLITRLTAERYSAEFGEPKIMTEVERMKTALAEMVYRNPIRHDGHAYDLHLALWALGFENERPEPDAFSQDAVDGQWAMEYAKNMARAEDED